jgi:hypothetical protein
MGKILRSRSPSRCLKDNSQNVLLRDRWSEKIPVGTHLPSVVMWYVVLDPVNSEITSDLEVNARLGWRLKSKNRIWSCNILLQVLVGMNTQHPTV